MQPGVLRIDDDFHEVGTKTIDDKNRLILGELIKGSKRVRLYKNERGELLLMPLTEIPTSLFSPASQLLIFPGSLFSRLSNDRPLKLT